MKSFKSSLFFLGFSVLIAGCTKETTIREEYNPNITIYGTWRVTEKGVNAGELSYVNFSTKKTSTSYFITQAGFKYSYSSSFVPYSDQVLVDVLSYGVALPYNYSYSGDTIILESGGKLLFKGVKALESEVTGWAEEINNTDEIIGVITDRQVGIGFDGTNLLIPDYSNSKVTKINLSTRLPAGDIAVSGSYPNTVEFDGTDIWVGSNGYTKFNRHSISGGSILSSSPNVGPWVYGIGFDPAGDDFWVYSGNEDSLYQVNRGSNKVTSTRYIGYNFRDAAWSNGKLFITRGQYIYRIKTNGFTIEKTYKLKNEEQIYGIAAVGNDFWLNVDGNKLIKVTLN